MKNQIPKEITSEKDNKLMRLVTYQDENERTNDICFYMDVFPVTNKEYTLYCQQSDSDWHPNDYKTSLNSEYWDCLPVVNLSYIEALQYAEWAGKMIPTKEEWEIAAGIKEQIYPTGDDFIAEDYVCIKNHNMDFVLFNRLLHTKYYNHALGIKFPYSHPSSRILEARNIKTEEEALNSDNNIFNRPIEKSERIPDNMIDHFSRICNLEIPDLTHLQFDKDEFSRLLAISGLFFFDEKRELVRILPEITQIKIDNLIKLLRDENKAFNNPKKTNKVKSTNYQIIEDYILKGVKPVNHSNNKLSPYGISGLCGNCWEFTSSCINKYDYCTKGGSFLSLDPEKVFRSSYNEKIDEKYSYSDLGFRCVKSIDN